MVGPYLKNTHTQSSHTVDCTFTCTCTGVGKHRLLELECSAEKLCNNNSHHNSFFQHHTKFDTDSLIGSTPIVATECLGRVRIRFPPESLSGFLRMSMIVILWDGPLGPWAGCQVCFFLLHSPSLLRLSDYPFSRIFTFVCIYSYKDKDTSVQYWGGGVAQLVEGRTEMCIPWSEFESRGPVRRTRKDEFSQNNVGVPCNPVCIRTQKNDHTRTHVKDPVVHVRVPWFTETWKDPACTCRTG